MLSVKTWNVYPLLLTPSLRAHRCLRCMSRTLLFRRRSASSRWSQLFWWFHYNWMWREYQRAKVLGMMHQFPGEWCWVFQISYWSRKVSVLSCRKSTKFLNSFVPFSSVSKPYFLYVCLTYLHICGLCREGGHSIWKPPFCNWLTNWLFLLLIPSFVFPQPAMVTSLSSRPPAKSPTPRYSDVTLWR